MKGSTIDCGFNLLGYARIYCLTPFQNLSWFARPATGAIICDALYYILINSDPF
jgi:hypothetical protein